MTQKVLIAGEWRTANASGEFHSTNPNTKQPIDESYPVSDWADIDAALDAAADAAKELQSYPAEKIAAFLEKYAERMEGRKDEIVAAAHEETALPVSPRLADGEFPRTTGQLRQAAAAVRSGSWRNAIIDTATGIRSCFEPIGPVCVFGPNNFPLAFGSVSGGDFAAAIAAGNPVIGKANSSHPKTTQLFAEEALIAAQETGMPAATVQLLYRTSHADGERMVSDPRVGATGYTGSRHAGLKLKAAADAAGKPIYLELSSVNPVVVLSGALRERMDEIVNEFSGSCLMGAGQFCTNPGLVVLIKGEEADAFSTNVAEKFKAAPIGTLLGEGVEKSLAASLKTLVDAGAEPLNDVSTGGGTGFSHSNTLLRVTGERFLDNAEALQTEAFGNSSLLVVADDIDQAQAVLNKLEGNLTGCIYSHTGGDDDAAYEKVAPALRSKVGRLLNDKMPTGVAVSPAMNHGGPFPATGHPGFTAVGLPAAIPRFAMLSCYDNVRSHRLPAILQDKNVSENTWRMIDGKWTTDSI